jgi:hypothetical protein
MIMNIPIPYFFLGLFICSLIAAFVVPVNKKKASYLARAATILSFICLAVSIGVPLFK